MRAWYWLLAAAFAIFAGLQFVRPEIGNPPITAELQAPAEVKQILRQSCYNCHSNETKLAWFDQIVPAYWLVASDVIEARMRLNFSEIGAQPAAAQKATLFEAVSQIQLRAMPLPSYRRVHPDAVVTASQLATLRAYLNPPVPVSAATEANVATADAQYAAWIAGVKQPPRVQAALNGLDFVPDYKNWRVINSTERFDNHTMREILGNDIAIKAIAENRINPWPNGTSFAKVAWQQQPDGKGDVRTGAFMQVELMIKDSAKYAATKGWGWGRWKGADLKPYGTSSAFTDECVGCHLPVRKSDYVYTVPVKALAGTFSSNPLEWRVVTSNIDTRGSNMSTLFGNDVAVEYAQTNSQHDYPAGSALALVTWTQREDDRWFGARIPAAPQSVEFVKINMGADHRPLYSFEMFEGAPLAKASVQESPQPSERSAYILSQRAAVMP